MPGIRRGFELRGQKEKGFLGLLLPLGYLRERGSRGGGGARGQAEEGEMVRGRHYCLAR